MLALGGGRLGDRSIGLDDARRGGRGLKPVHVAAGRERQGRGQQHRRNPKAAALPSLAPSRQLRHFSYSFLSGELVPAKYFNLPDMEHFNSRPAPRLDPAADANPSIFEGLKNNSSRLESG